MNFFDVMESKARYYVHVRVCKLTVSCSIHFTSSKYSYQLSVLVCQ